MGHPRLWSHAVGFPSQFFLGRWAGSDSIPSCDKPRKGKSRHDGRRVRASGVLRQSPAFQCHTYLLPGRRHGASRTYRKSAQFPMQVVYRPSIHRRRIVRRLWLRGPPLPGELQIGGGADRWQILALASSWSSWGWLFAAERCGLPLMSMISYRLNKRPSSEAVGCRFGSAVAVVLLSRGKLPPKPGQMKLLTRLQRGTPGQMKLLARLQRG
jgi:hypothetical protein